MPNQTALDKSARWLSPCTSLIDGFSFSTTDRALIVASLYHLSIEHATGIHVLVERDVVGSAFALSRPQNEAYFRGAWYQWCASEKQVSDFLRDGTPPKLGKLLEELEKKDAYRGGSLTRIKTKGLRNLNDFTHGGATQVNARNTSDEIVQRYKAEHIADLLASSAVSALLAGVGIASLAEDTILANKLLKGNRPVSTALIDPS